MELRVTVSSNQRSPVNRCRRWSGAGVVRALNILAVDRAAAVDGDGQGSGITDPLTAVVEDILHLGKSQGPFVYLNLIDQTAEGCLAGDLAFTNPGGTG